MDRATPSLKDVDDVFAALAHEARRHIVLLLSHAGGELGSGYLNARFQHSWPTTTRHLSVLEQAGIIDVRREGRNSHYRLNRDRLRLVVEGWLHHLTPVDPDKTWEPTGPRALRDLTAPHAATTTTKSKPKKTTTRKKGRASS